MPAAPHQDLGFDDPFVGRLGKKRADVFRRSRVVAARDGDAGAFEKLLALILHEIHSGPIRSLGRVPATLLV